MRFVNPTARRRACVFFVALAAWHLTAGRLLAGGAESVEPAVAAEVNRLIAELDDAQFSTRSKAAARLEELAGEGELAAFLAGRFRRALLSPTASFEVRSRLESLLRSLGKTPVGGDEPKPSPAEITPLLDQLHSDSYAERDSAQRRLKAMLAHVELIAPLWLELKSRAANPAISASGRRALAPLVEQVHAAWLLADPAKVPLPKPTREQIAGWIDEMRQPSDVVRTEVRRGQTSAEDTFREQNQIVPAGRHRRMAERELLDLIARDDTRPVVLEMLAERIEPAEDSPRTPLDDLVDFARPAMAAEVWSNHQHIYQQYLIIGMPQYNETAVPPRATLFDRIDEQQAHCVSGNALTPGDYPVRVAIPHPQPGQETMYYLTNLPTPRRRLAYEYHRRRDERLRLEEITERTLNYYLNRRTPLAETEVLMLAQLDSRTVSRMIGAYFQTVPDGPLITTLNGLISQPTVHGGICAVVSRLGTREAVPALERLAKSGLLGKLSNENRIEVAWVAALAIATRDPWPGIDEWLAALVDDKRPLTNSVDHPPELGASAAGLLLDRHGASTAPFGLQTAGESVTDSYRFIGYRFSSESDRADVKRWWQKRQALAAAGRAASRSSKATPKRRSDAQPRRQ